MNLWVGALLLVMVQFSSSTAPTADECRTLVTPDTTFKAMYGRWTLILAYSDNPVFAAMYASTKSMWIDFLNVDMGGSMELVEDVGIRHPTYCKYATTKLTTVLNTAVSQKSNFTCTYYSLPTCSGCLLYYVRAINNVNQLVIPNPTSTQDINKYKAFYLMSTKRKLKAADIENAKKQAECLGFTGEPDFLYNTSNTFCNKAVDP